MLTLLNRGISDTLAVTLINFKTKLRPFDQHSVYEYRHEQVFAEPTYIHTYMLRLSHSRKKNVYEICRTRTMFTRKNLNINPFWLVILSNELMNVLCA